MVDPVGITGGALSIALSALHIARKLKELIDGIQGAPEAVKALSNDLHALRGVLEALNSLLEDSRFTERRLGAEAMPALEPHLQNCTTTLDSIFMAIARHTKPSGDPKKSKWSGFVWAFREKEILTLQNKLTTYKMSLDLAVSVANLTKSSASFSEIRKSIRGMRKRVEEDRESVADSSFMGSSITGSDYAFAMKQWLRETESIMGDHPPCPLVSRPGTMQSEVENRLSRRSSGALSDQTSSYSGPSGDDAGLISLTKCKEDTFTGEVRSMLTAPGKCYLPICTTDNLCWSTTFPRGFEQQACLDSKPEPALQSSALKESLHNGDNAEQSLWINRMPKAVGVISNGEKEEEVQAAIGKCEFAKLSGSQVPPTIHPDEARRSSIGMEHLRNFADTASSDIRMLHASESREGHRMNQDGKLLRPVASAQSLGGPESLAAKHIHTPVASTLSRLHRSASAVFESTTRQDILTTSSDIGNALECQRPSEQRTSAEFSNTSEVGATPKDDHDSPQRRGQGINYTAASNEATDKPLLPPRHHLYQIQSAPVSRCRWIENKQVDYEGDDYGDNTSIYPNSISAPVTTPSVSLELLAERDGVLTPNFVKDCIWMLDMHGLHLPEAFGDDEVADELNQLRLLLAGDIPLELGLVMDLSCVYPTQEQLIKVRALLRYFFKSLAQPLFTGDFYDTISAAAAPKPVYSQYYILRDFIPRLPDAHYETAKQLIPHLHRVCQARSAKHVANKRLASIWANILLPHDLFTTSEGREDRELLLQTLISSAPQWATVLSRHGLLQKACAAHG